MNKLRKEIYLHISGFNIKVNLPEPYEGFSLSDLKNYFLKRLGNIVLSNVPSNIDYFINFISLEKPEMIYLKKEKKIFLNIFEKTNKNSITCYYWYSEKHLNIVLGEIITQLLSKEDGFITHSSAVNFEGQAMLFLGCPGAGKTTILSYLKRKYPPLANDAGIVVNNNNDYFFYQSPILERSYKGLKTKSIKYPIKAVFILKKAKFNKIEKLNNKNYILKLIMEMSKNFLADNTTPLLNFVRKFDRFYLLYFMKDAKKTIQMFEEF